MTGRSIVQLTHMVDDPEQLIKSTKRKGKEV